MKHSEEKMLDQINDLTNKLIVPDMARALINVLFAPNPRRNQMNHSEETIENIARVCHEANRAYCETIGDGSQAEWENAKDWQVESARAQVKFCLKDLAAGIETFPSRSHESWLKEKLDHGWKYGPVKDAELKEHPCCVPYEDLPVEQRRKDYLFGAIVKALSGEE